MADLYLQDDGRTLENKLGIVHDPETLEKKEALYVERRAMELHAQGLPLAEGFERVKAVHRYLFQDVYEWAGEPRKIDLARARYAESSGDDLVQFTPAHQIEQEGHRLFEDLAAVEELRGLTRERFAEALAPFFGRLNELHPFREGNGRTQRLIWEHIAREAGHELSFEGISRERMTAVSIAASTSDYASAHRMFAELLDPARSYSLRTATRFLESNRTPSFDWQERYIATTEPGQSYAGTFVSAGGSDFLMHDGRNLYVGRLADLPRDGRDLRAGDHVAFLAGTFTPAPPSPDLSVEERLRERVEQRAQQLPGEWASEREGRQRAPEQQDHPLEREQTLEKPRGPSHDLDFDD